MYHRAVMIKCHKNFATNTPERCERQGSPTVCHEFKFKCALLTRDQYVLSINASTTVHQSSPQAERGPGPTCEPCGPGGLAS